MEGEGPVSEHDIYKILRKHLIRGEVFLIELPNYTLPIGEQSRKTKNALRTKTQHRNDPQKTLKGKRPTTKLYIR